MNVDTIDDPLMREATIAQISSYGQTPKLLFTSKHPPKNYNKLHQAIQECIFSKPDSLIPYPSGSSNSPVGSIVLVNELPLALGIRKVAL